MISLTNLDDDGYINLLMTNMFLYVVCVTNMIERIEVKSAFVVCVNKSTAQI